MQCSCFSWTQLDTQPWLFQPFGHSTWSASKSDVRPRLHSKMRVNNFNKLVEATILRAGRRGARDGRASWFLHVLRDFSGPLRHWKNGHIIGTDTSAVCLTRRSEERSCGTSLLNPRISWTTRSAKIIHQSLHQFEEPKCPQFLQKPIPVGAR